jgi:hypothetical protein
MSDEEIVLRDIARQLIRNAIDDVTWMTMSEYDDRLDDVDLTILDTLLDNAIISWED